MFNNFYGAGVGGGYSWPYYNDRLTRGGPLAIQPPRWAVNLNSNSDTRRLASIRLHAEYAHSASGASSWYILPGTDIRPATNIHVTVGPSLGRDYITGQYVRTVTDALATNTYGKRYVFASLHQTTFAIDSRVEWTFTPVLSFQVTDRPSWETPRFLRLGVSSASAGTRFPSGSNPARGS